MQDIIVVGALRRRANGDTAGPQGLQGASGGPGEISKRHSTRPLHPQARPAPPSRMGPPRPGPGHGVGDAGCYKDPYLALDICDAFRDAELLVDGIHDGLTGVRALNETLADYERRRNEATIAEVSHESRSRAVHTAARRPATAASCPPRQPGGHEPVLPGAREGMIPPELFFNPENLQRIMASAAAEV
jgi:hypothetical protein